MIGICGGSGYIGSALYEYLISKGENVMGTYCKNKKPGLIKYDLRTTSFTMFSQCSYVIITSAYKVKFCEENAIEAHFLNVYRTKGLLEYLDGQNIPAFFISSAIAVKPDTKYGKYKAEVERFIRIHRLKARFNRPGPVKVNEETIKPLCEEIYNDYQSGRREKVTA